MTTTKRQAVRAAVMCYSDGRWLGTTELAVADWERYAAGRHEAYQWPEGIARAGDVLDAREVEALGIDPRTTIYLD